MKKLFLAAGVAVVVFGGWRWQSDRDRHKVEVYNRFWIDHIPLHERDPFNVFIAHTPPGIGGFAKETQWHGEVERFRFQPGPGEIRAVFPWTGDRETIKVEATRCDAEGFDFCLTLTGSNHGVKTYYSRKGWEHRDFDDIETLLAK